MKKLSAFRPNRPAASAGSLPRAADVEAGCRARPGRLAMHHPRRSVADRTQQRAAVCDQFLIHVEIVLRLPPGGVPALVLLADLPAVEPVEIVNRGDRGGFIRNDKA